MPKVLIVGYGNSLRSDDGVGVAVAEALAEQYRDDADVRVMAAIQLTPELASDIADAQHVLFVDAAAEGRPGTIQKFPITAGDTGQLQTHHCTPGALLHLADQLYDRAADAMLLTISAESFEPGPKLSSPVEERVPDAIALAKRLVSEWCRSSADLR